MARRRTSQPTLIDTPSGYRHRYCRRCGRELTAPASRRNFYGPDCDPARHPPAAADHQVDQDAIPGM